MRLIDADRMKEELLWGNVFLTSKEINTLVDLIDNQPTLTPQNEPLTIEQLRKMKDEPAYLKMFDPLLQSGWHIIKAVTTDKIIFRGWQTAYVPVSGMGVDYNLYRRPPERQEDQDG